MIELFIPVTPKTKKRPRFGKNGAVYTPSQTKKAERDIHLIVSAYMNIHQIKKTDRPVIINATFQYYKKDLLLYSGNYKSSAPDLDNLMKLLGDSLNDLVYVDDRQIVKFVCEKVYASCEGIDLKVTEVYI